MDLNKRVRSNNPLRKIAEVIDFGFVREEVHLLYGRNGNESVDPEIILKMMFLLFLGNVKSERDSPDIRDVFGYHLYSTGPADAEEAKEANDAIKGKITESTGVLDNDFREVADAEGIIFAE